MKASKSQKWNVPAQDPPSLTNTQWTLSGVVGALLIVAAVLQLISFSDFRDNFDKIGLPGPTAWAVGVIFAELWGAAYFFKLRLSYLFRGFAAALAVLAIGFWFVDNLQLISSGKAETLANSNYFGRFLEQQPGWWTAIEVTIAFFLMLWVLDLSRSGMSKSGRK